MSSTAQNQTGSKNTMIQNIIYVDKCDPILKDQIQKQLSIEVAVRDMDLWGDTYLIRTITDPGLKLIVLNTIDELAIVEIALAMFMCKQILVTSNVIEQYDRIKDMINYIDLSCSLLKPTSSFLTWYTYTFGAK
jgi:hypothetical protein